MLWMIDLRTDSRCDLFLQLTSALRKYHSNQMQDKAFLDRKLFLRDGIQRIVGQNFGGKLCVATACFITFFDS